MIDFMLSIFSSIFQMDLRDHHEVPFAMPLLMGAFMTGIATIIAIYLLRNGKRSEADEIEHQKLIKQRFPDYDA